MRSSLFVRVGADRLDPSDALAFVADPGAGATVLFEGSVRDHSADGDVTGRVHALLDETRPRTAGLVGAATTTCAGALVAIAVAAHHTELLVEVLKHHR